MMISCLSFSFDRVIVGSFKGHTLVLCCCFWLKFAAIMGACPKSFIGSIDHGLQVSRLWTFVFDRGKSSLSGSFFTTHW